MTAPTTGTIGTTGVLFPAAPTTTTSTTSTAPKTGSKTLDKNAFLKLLVTQLKNQDPTNPQDTSQMAAQLAQYSQVEQLTNINATLSAQSASATAQTNATQTAFASSLMGQRVVATGNALAVASDGTATATIDNGAASGNGTLTLTDATGAVVATRNLGTLPPGTQVIPLKNLPAGTYTYAVNVTSPGGTATAATAYISGIVSGLNFATPGTASLSVGGIDVPLSSVIEVDRAN